MTPGLHTPRRSTLVGLLRLCRPYYPVPFALAFALTVYYARGGQMGGQWAALAWATAALAMVISAGYVLNDVFDLAVDRLGAPDRPLPSGQVSRAAAVAFAAALLAGALVLALLTCRGAFAAGLAGLAGGLAAYDALSKRLGPGKQIAVALLTASIYPLAFAQAGQVAGPRAGSLAVFPVWLLLTAYAYELLKDLRDAPADSAAARRDSWAGRHPAGVRRLAVGLLLGAAPLLIAPALLGCGWVYLTGALAAMACALAAARLPVRQAIAAVYAECFLVGLAAAADVIVLG